MVAQTKKGFKNIKLLALDFDGIFTDGTVYTDQDKKESVKCSRRDGLGFDMLRNAGVPACIVSQEKNLVVSARAKKLQLPYWQSIQGSQSKLEILENHCKELKIKLNKVAYMGDDINDLAVLREVGLPITVPAAHPLVKKVARYITKRNGGDGAIREIIEKILTAQGFDLEKLVL